MTIFNIYFSYPFERTLPRKPLDRHQCQWLDMLYKLECERKNAITFCFSTMVDNFKYLLVPFHIRTYARHSFVA